MLKNYNVIYIIINRFIKKRYYILYIVNDKKKSLK